MNFEEFRTKLESELGKHEQFELQEFNYLPYSYGSGILGYRIKGICFKLTYDGRDDELILVVSQPHKKYSSTEWSELLTFNGLDNKISEIVEQITQDEDNRA